MHPVLKVLITAALIVIITEVSKRTGYLGGLFASLPLVSYLSIIWLYAENDNKQEAAQIVSQLSTSVLWFILPTLPFFLILPWLLKHLPFAGAMAISTVFMFACYASMVWVLSKYGIEVI